MDVPFMALTASAPSDIQDIIVTSLHLKDPVFVSCDLDRPNIYVRESNKDPVCKH